MYDTTCTVHVVYECMNMYVCMYVHTYIHDICCINIYVMYVCMYVAHLPTTTKSEEDRMENNLETLHYHTT